MRALYRKVSLKDPKSIIIYGAGSAGSKLLHLLQYEPHISVVELIIDDDPSVQGKLMFGLKVNSYEEASKKFSDMGIQSVIIAIPSASFSDRQKIIKRLAKHSLEVKTIPELSSLIEGTAHISSIQDMPVDDLLDAKLFNQFPNL